MVYYSASRKCLLAITGAFNHAGGIAAVNRLIIHALSEAGYELHLVALNEPITSKSDYSQFSGLHYSGMGGNKLRFTLAAWRAALSHQYRLVFCDHVNLAAMLRPLTTLGLIQYSVFLHGVEVFQPAPSFEGRIGLHGAQRRIANSVFTQKKVNKQFPDIEIAVCDLGLSPAQSNAIKQIEPNSNELCFAALSQVVHYLHTRVILHVGRMSSGEQYKGQDTLIRAMPYILSECPQAQLVLVGDGDDFERLKHLVCAQSPQVQSAIFMPGYVPDSIRNALYKQCCLFALPSWGEGFGLVYIEAMLCGKPCIGSRFDAAQCIIQDGETGFLVDDPRNPHQVAEKIIYLLKHENIASEMGQAGYQRVQDYYFFPHFKDRFLKAVGL